MGIVFQLLIAAILSIISVHSVFLAVLRIAKVKNLVDNPNARKLQKNPVPVLGGIAVFFGLLIGVLTFIAVDKMILPETTMSCRSILTVLICANVMLYIGSMDDIVGLTPTCRLLVEIFVILAMILGTNMCIDSLHGLWGVYQFSWWIAVPLTIFTGVGLINAYNMIDGVNGLSSGLCIACSSMLAIVCWKRCEYVDCALAVCFAASLIPFLLHNVFGDRSRMFIGDGGTMVMGLLVSWFVIRVLSSDNANSIESLARPNCTLGLVAMMLSIASVPVFDTLRVMTSRAAKGISPFHADKTHLHHVFIAVGISHSITALSEILINVAIVAIWYISYRMGATVDTQLYIVIFASVMLVWGMYWFLSRVVRKHPDSPTFKWAKRTHLGHTKWWLALQKVLDKGAYVDYNTVLEKKYNKDLQNMTLKEKDTAAIVNYLQGRSKVPVEDIISESGADKLRVYPILFELKQANVIKVIEEQALGAPKVVELNND